MNSRSNHQPCGSTSTTLTAKPLEQEIYVIDPSNEGQDKRKNARSCFESIDMDRKTVRETHASQAKLIPESLVVDADVKDKHWDTTPRQVIVGAIYSLLRDSERNARQGEPVPSPLKMVRRALENQTEY